MFLLLVSISCTKDTVELTRTDPEVEPTYAELPPEDEHTYPNLRLFFDSQSTMHAFLSRMEEAISPAMWEQWKMGQDTLFISRADYDTLTILDEAEFLELLPEKDSVRDREDTTHRFDTTAHIRIATPFFPPSPFSKVLVLPLRMTSI